MLNTIRSLGRRFARRLFVAPSPVRPPAPTPLGCERLEPRDVPSTLYGSYNVDIIGRTAGGQWWSGGTNGTGGSSLNSTPAASWSSAVNWKFTQHADTNDDQLTDVISWEPTGGDWWVGYGTGDQLQNVKAGNWNPAAGWRDVQTADLNGDGKDELIGRTSGGGWYAGFFREEGTMVNRYLGAWNEAAGWRDVKAADLNGDGRDEIVGRTSGGAWYAATFYDGSPLVSRLIAGWNEAAGWTDVRFGDLNGSGGEEIVARTSGGYWYRAAYDVNTQALSTAAFGYWNPAAGWKDVKLADVTGDRANELVGRTSTGQWWKATFADAGFTTAAIGAWNEAAGWRDVQVADVNGDLKDDLIGRTSGGGWYAGVAGTNGALTNGYLGAWNEAAGWRDVKVGRVKATFSGMGSLDNGQLDILGYRAGTTVDVNQDTFLNQINVTVRYTRPDGTPVSEFGSFYRPIVRSIVFQGGIGNDTFRTSLTSSSIPVYAYGGLGNDDLEGGAGVEYLDGGEGDDILRSGSYNSAVDVLDGGPGRNRYDRGFGLTASATWAASATAWATQPLVGPADPSAANYLDIAQGGYGNCYFWTALAAASEAGVNLTSASRITHAGGNNYTVKLFKKSGSSWVSDVRTVSFDWQNGTMNTNRFEDGGSGDPRVPAEEPDFWHVLYWRAWQQVYGNVAYPYAGYTDDDDLYVGGEGGFAGLVLPTLTGVNNSVDTGIGRNLSSAVQTTIRNAIIEGASTNQYAVATSTIGSDAALAGKDRSAYKPPLDSKGQVVRGHVYMVVSATASYIELFNPWGEDASMFYYDQIRGNKDEVYDEDELLDYRTNGVFEADDGVIQLSWANYFSWFGGYTINPV